MTSAPPQVSTIERVKVAVRGAVQGVGFRPYVYRLAREMRLRGWVVNSPQGVLIEAEGARQALNRFVFRLEADKPPRAIVQSLEVSYIDATGEERDFTIRDSERSGEKAALIMPDLATCPDCLREIFDPRGRRHRYPFTNCTHCGPRFSIIEALPYDRPNTSMKAFAMCPECDREYHDPLDRRFHAQPNACPRCGPQLALWDADGARLCERDDALREAAAFVRNGKIVALKGVGGFQLLVDARDERAVARLRERKRRCEKPLALLYPSLAMAREHCEISEMEERLLHSAEAPIVLLRRKLATDMARCAIAPSVAPRNPSLGVMLPCSPLHHLFARELGFPVVATSGNLSDEPICTDERAAVRRLAGIADAFLIHDRPIVRHSDDSVACVMLGRESLLRRARGYAPLPVQLPEPAPRTLAVGAHLKNCVALNIGNTVFISQHIGDLEAAEAHAAFLNTAADLPRLYDAAPERIVCDLHPDYLSTKFAEETGRRPKRIQHHWAHIAACMAENGLRPPVLGVAWDGSGFGPDGTIWGGEFLLATGCGFERVAHLQPFRLAGGAAAIREPRRAMLGALHETFGDALWTRGELLGCFSRSELCSLRRMIEKSVNSPLTSSVGRLFDAVSALIGACERASFEGQAAMELEFAVAPGVGEFYSCKLRGDSPAVIDWRPALAEVVRDVDARVPAGVIAAKFHNALIEALVAVARKIGEPVIALSGGCFQNRYLTERVVTRLREEGFNPHWHRRVPPNDGCIALGQIAAAAWADERAPQ